MNWWTSFVEKRLSGEEGMSQHATVGIWAEPSKIKTFLRRDVLAISLAFFGEAKELQRAFPKASLLRGLDLAEHLWTCRGLMPLL
jgi:hypothetical protein